jgi:outer membrane protease
MKNITLFIIFVIIFYTSMTGTRVWAQYSGPVPSPSSIKNKFPYTLSVTPAAGFLYGYGEEIVYKYPGKDTYMSQLLWNIKPLFYAGGVLDFSRINPMEKWGFFTALSLKAGFPGKTGIMEDRDWLAPGDALSNYSRSDNYTDRALLFDYLLGLTLPLKSFALLKFHWSFSWMSFYWTGRDGYLRYPRDQLNKPLHDTPLDDSVEKKPLYGPLISYSQDWIITSPGLSVFFPLPRRFGAELSFQISPLVFCFARDDHLLRNVEFRDYISGGLYLEPRGTIVFSPHERFELSLYVSYRFVKGAPGESYGRETGENKTGEFDKYSEDPGAAFYALDSGLSFKIRF